MLNLIPSTRKERHHEIQDKIVEKSHKSPLQNNQPCGEKRPPSNELLERNRPAHVVLLCGRPICGGRNGCAASRTCSSFWGALSLILRTMQLCATFCCTCNYAVVTHLLVVLWVYGFCPALRMIHGRVFSLVGWLVIARVHFLAYILRTALFYLSCLAYFGNPTTEQLLYHKNRTAEIR